MPELGKIKIKKVLQIDGEDFFPSEIEFYTYAGDIIKLYFDDWTADEIAYNQKVIDWLEENEVRRA